MLMNGPSPTRAHLLLEGPPALIRFTPADEWVELGTIRDLLGHTTTRMTERYAHVTPGHLHDAVQRVSRTGTRTGTGDQRR